MLLFICARLIMNYFASVSHFFCGRCSKKTFLTWADKWNSTESRSAFYRERQLENGQMINGISMMKNDQLSKNWRLIFNSFFIIQNGMFLFCTLKQAKQNKSFSRQQNYFFLLRLWFKLFGPFCRSNLV